MKSNKIKILFLGNIPIEKHKNSIGGATVLTKRILEFLDTNAIFQISHKQLRKTWIPKLQLIDYFLWIFKMPFYLKRIDIVSIHATKDIHFTIAPILILWCKIFKKKTVYHFFGGNFDRQYKSLPTFIKKIIDKTILSSDVVFFETKSLIKFFKNKGTSKYVWLPNARNPVVDKIKTTFDKKFVFISRVIPHKGIDTIIEASKNLPIDYTIDIYGPLEKKYYSESYFESCQKINYKGTLKPDEVVKVIKEYNVLLLPTYFEGEGYPGIIIESLSVGNPVITTNWISIPEIITHKGNGLLIDIKQVDALTKAILFFNEQNYKTYAKEAYASFNTNFNLDNVFCKISQEYKNLSK